MTNSRMHYGIITRMDSKHMMIFSQKTKKENWNRLYLQLIQTGYA